MGNYYRRLFAALWRDFLESTREQVIGALLAFGIFLYQNKFGIIDARDIRPNLSAIVWPYVMLVAVLFVGHLIRIPYNFDKERQREIGRLNSEKEDAEARISRLTTAPDSRGKILEVCWEQAKDEYGDRIPNGSLFY